MVWRFGSRAALDCLQATYPRRAQACRRTARRSCSASRGPSSCCPWGYSGSRSRNRAPIAPRFTSQTTSVRDPAGEPKTRLRDWAGRRISARRAAPKADKRPRQRSWERDERIPWFV